MAEMLYPDGNESVKRRSSIDQFSGFLSVWKQGGWAPVVFDQLDGITCERIESHPVVIDLYGDSLGYVFPEAHCTYASDKFIYADQEGVEQRLLPACFGGKGEWYDTYVRKNSFIGFDGPDGGSSLGVHNQATLRVGASYVTADETLPAVN